MLLTLSLVCALAPTAADSPGPISVVASPNVPLPLQPFTVELLDLERGRWTFDDALGQRLSLEGPVGAFAFAEKPAGDPRLAYLCCDPEFPDDLAHAELRLPSLARQEEDRAWFRIDEPFFGAEVSVSPPRDGVARCELRSIHLGPAITGDRYVAGLYLLVGGQAWPLWLAPDAEGSLSPRLLTDRVGNVFAEGEPVSAVLAASWQGAPAARRFAIEAADYATGKVVWRGELSLKRGSGLSLAKFSVPLTRFGVFQVSATAEDTPGAVLRVCRLPRPADVQADRSTIGMNIFQQQIWWYAYQVPLMAKAGVHWIRPWLAWENTWNNQEPEQGKWDTRALDSALRRMDAYGQRYQLILFGTPSWMSAGGGFGAPAQGQVDAWSAYVERLVSQYRGRIRCYEVWNEPDLMWPEETRASGEHYVAVLKATYAAAKRADPECVVLGLSAAGWEDWMAKVAGLGAGDYYDIATLHCYSPPSGFAATVERRRAILERGGGSRRPIWVNELGSTAYDFSPAYSRQFACSERAQASGLAALYAEAMSLDPAMKAYWFCTYDPRDAAHESQWTGDAGIGVLYLGFLPKLSYAALAATAHQIDGRRCLGRADISRDLHQVSFDGPVAVVWHDQPAGAGRVAATALGCLPDEPVTVKDIYTNVVASGCATDVELDLSQGTLFVEGSSQMAAIARCEAAFGLSPSELCVAPGGSATLKLKAPSGLRAAVVPSAGLPVSASVIPRGIRVSAPAGAERASGSVSVSLTFPAGRFGLAQPYEAARRAFVTIGVPNLIRDGTFALGGLDEWTPERTSPYVYDPYAGHPTPGSLRLDGPFDRRLVHWNTMVAAGRDTRLRCWVKTEALAGCLATLNVAVFAADHWIDTWCLASTDPSSNAKNGWRMVESPAKIPTGTDDWTLVEAVLPAGALPPETDHAAFFTDARDGTGKLWIDALDLWQPGPD